MLRQHTGSINVPSHSKNTQTSAPGYCVPSVCVHLTPSSTFTQPNLSAPLITTTTKHSSVLPGLVCVVCLHHTHQHQLSVSPFLAR